MLRNEKREKKGRRLKQSSQDGYVLCERLVDGIREGKGMRSHLNDKRGEACEFC